MSELFGISINVSFHSIHPWYFYQGIFLRPVVSWWNRASSNHRFHQLPWKLIKLDSNCFGRKPSIPLRIYMSNYITYHETVKFIQGWKSSSARLQDAFSYRSKKIVWVWAGSPYVAISRRETISRREIAISRKKLLEIYMKLLEIYMMRTKIV